MSKTIFYKKESTMRKPITFLLLLLIHFSSYFITYTNELNFDDEHEYIIGATIDSSACQIGVFKIVNDKSHLVLSIVKPIHIIDDFTEFIEEICEYLYTNYDIVISRACFSSAGLTTENREFIQSPHLSFPIDGKDIKEQSGLSQAWVINDFEILGYGIQAEPEQFNNVRYINAGKKRKDAPKLLIGAGNGFGSSLLVWNKEEKRYTVIPLGASFIDFAPLNKKQQQFAQYLKEKNDYHARWGYTLGSLGGLVAIYNYLAEQDHIVDYLQPKDAQTIFNNRTKNPLCKKAVDFYLKLYAQLIRQAAYFTLPYGGVYITNTIAFQNSDLLMQKTFTKHLFNADYPGLNKLLLEIPLYISTDQSLGLYGTAQYLIEAQKIQIR